MAEISFSSFWRVVSSFCCPPGVAWAETAESSRSNSGVETTTLPLEILIAARRDRLHPGEVVVPVRFHPREGRGRPRPEDESPGRIREGGRLDGAGDVHRRLSGRSGRQRTGV